MTSTPRKGDSVSWKTPQGETEGTVEKIVKSTIKVKGHVAQATEENPQVVVKSEKSGKTAVHKPEQLKKK